MPRFDLEEVLSNTKHIALILRVVENGSVDYIDVIPHLTLDALKQNATDELFE